MLLSNLIGMPVFVGEKQRGTLQGVFLSAKSKSIKYLLCAIEQKNTQTTLALSIAALDKIENGIYLNPAYEEVREYIISGVKEIIENL